MAFFFSRLLSGLSLVSLFPLLYAMAAGEAVTPFLLMFAVSAGLSVGLRLLGAKTADGLSLREGIAITSLGWLFCSGIGSVPYIAGGHLGVVDGVLESVSGFTGAGATVITALSRIPNSILLWRSMTHWIGGLGIVVFFIALLPQFGEGAARIFETESGTPVPTRTRPRMKTTAQVLFAIYLVLTLAATAAYWAAGMTFFDAVNHSMSTIATGGFSTHDESAAYFHSPAIEWCMILFMLLCGLDFGMYIGILRDGVKAALKNVEMRFFLVMVAVSSFVLAAELFTSGMNVGEAVRTAIFQSTTVASTTGFVSADFDQWPPLSKMCLLFMMAVGGCSGSTAGGIKVIRILLVVKLIGLGGRRALSPLAREEVQLGGRTVSRDVLFGAGYFLFTYCALVGLWSLIFTWDGSSAFDSVALAVTTMGNVGPGFGEWGATCNYAALPTLSKLTVAASMLIGRLEIFPMLALLRPGFWRKERGWD